MANRVTLQIKRRAEEEGRIPPPLPTYATVGSAGLDVVADLREPVTLSPMQRILIPTGLFLALPEGYELQLRPRSGLALKQGITLLNTPGTIDADYRGEIQIILVNLGSESVVINPGDRIAQMVVSPVMQAAFEEVSMLPSTARGQGGFGHSGC